MQALRRGPTERGNPAVEGASTLIERHPKSNLVYILAERSPFYRGEPEICHRAAQDFMGNIAVQGADIRAIIATEQTHAYNTWFPGLQEAIRSYTIESAHLQDVA
jgi:hypothetical protein